MKPFLIIFSFLFLCSFSLSAKIVDADHLKKKSTALQKTAQLKTLTEDSNIHFLIDTGKKALPKDRTKLEELILKLNKKIKELETEQQLALEKERSFFGKLTQGLSDSFVEQKLNYLKSLRNFLIEEKDKLETLGIGVKKASDTVSEML